MFWCKTIIEQEKDKHSIIDLEQYEGEKKDNSLNVLCDFNKKEKQLTKVTNFDSNKLAIIDHHEIESETFDAVLKHIDSCASSTSEIITHLLEQFQISISKDMANILLAGIILDTNRITSSNVTGNTMRTCGKLLDCGASMEQSYNYFIEDFKSDRKIQRLINNTQFLDTIGLVIGNNKTKYTRGELAKAANYLLRFNVNSTYAIGNIGNGVVSISARSKSDVNVKDVMGALNGGGTKNHAATKITGVTTDEAGEKLLKLVFPKQK